MSATQRWKAHPVAVGFVVVALAGCAVPGSGSTPGDARALPGEETFGYSVEGRPIRGTVLGAGPETLLLCGVVHGNEPLGKPLLEQFLEHARAEPRLTEGRRLVVVPVSNPDGLAHRIRHNARGVDLNRNFPARNWKPSRTNGPAPGSEPETRALIKIIRQFAPKRILAVHSPLHVVNYDGPAEALARGMADACGYSVTGSIGYPTPGSLGCYAGTDWNTPTITLELGRGVTSGNVWPRFRKALEIFILYPAMTLVAEP